jgi:methylenetetrahydrofolate reductase (NADPH)
MKKTDIVQDEDSDFSKLSECHFSPTKPFISVEYFPPKTENGLQSLYKKLQRIRKLNPLFIDITWGAGGSTSDLSMDLTLHCKQKVNIRPNMHLTCTNMDEEKIKDTLTTCKKNGIRNILALRGDPPIVNKNKDNVKETFSCALDLIDFIQKEHEDFFHISVAGYPEGHPDAIEKVLDYESLSESEKKRCSKNVDTVRSNALTSETTYFVCRDVSYENEIRYLKKKVDAGATMIFTQIFFDASLFIDFVLACRRHEIFVPIIPGILCIHSIDSFFRMTNFCKSMVPEHLLQKLHHIKTSNEQNSNSSASEKSMSDQVIEFGIEWGTSLCQELLDFGVDGLHFYSLNQETVIFEILKRLSFPQKE